jgi:glutathione peroxidase
MKRVWVVSLFLLACDAGASSKATVSEAAASQGPVIEHIVKTIDGKDKSLADYRGKALLVVNTASQCGFTPQYEGLQELYAKYKDRGFEVLAFPSNDFGGQEPGSESEIATFVVGVFGVLFPMVAKVPVKGEGKVPLYTTLTEQTPEGIKGEIKWNFTKFLVDPSGHVIARYAPNVDPMDTDLTAKLESVLPKAG